MRKRSCDRLLTGVALTLFVAAASPGFAAAERGEQAAPRSQAAVVSPADLPVSERLRALLTSKSAAKRAGDAKEIDSFYAARNYAPLWVHDGALTGQAKAVIARLKNAANDGLDATDYPVPAFGGGAEADAISELKLTVSALTFARHLEIGRIAPTRVTADVDYDHRAPDTVALLRAIANARDIDATFDSFNPPEAGFRALKAKLAELRAASANASADETRIADGPPIRLGGKDTRIPLLRARLGLKARAPDLVYDKALYNAIRRLQENHRRKPTGLIDNQTIALINPPTRNQVIDRVVANMERWRWLPRDLGRSYVMVNIPDYTLKVVHNNREVWHTKIVAGKPATPTPLVSAPMQNVIVNPSWYVPQSIIQNELLPLYASDHNIFDRLGLEVKKGPDGRINVVQPPGAANALGRIKLAFPNRFQVYLHDTPEKKLFASDRRAFSHGCMRVEDPTKFGEIILAMSMSGPTPNARQLNAMFGEGERTYRLVERPMVHLTYQTAFVDERGKLQLRDDLYGFDARIHAILHSDERRVADIAPPPDPKRDLDTDKANQEILRRVERREADNPFAFFERIFR
jgi:murein L,D-transpeptidase YcbB/YkuD